jgi:dTDP-4-dehydrorhamnose reductase
LRVLIVGASGQVGSALISAAPREYEITAPNSKDLDIVDSVSVGRAFARYRPELVINAAAHTGVDKAETERELAYAINADGAGNLARACRRDQVRLMHLSTDYVFDGRSSNAYREDDPPNPLNVYGASKLAGERQIIAEGPPFFILRVSWVFSSVGTNFVRTMLRLASRDVLGVVDDQHGTPCAASDIARVLWLAAARQAQMDAGLLMHFASTPPTTWFGFANAIFATALKLGVLRHLPRVDPISTDQYPTPAQRPANSLLNAEALQRFLGIEPPDWRDALESVLRDLARSSPVTV